MCPIVEYKAFNKPTYFEVYIGPHETKIIVNLHNACQWRRKTDLHNNLVGKLTVHMLQIDREKENKNI